jgi:hypothetical protein
MAIQTMILDPDAVAYTDDEIIAKINAANDDITREASVSAAARPLEAGEVTNTILADGAARDNLDEMSDGNRKYVKTNPGSGEHKIISCRRNSSGNLAVDYDDIPEV